MARKADMDLLLRVLNTASPLEVAQLRRERFMVHAGLLSVGLKLHCPTYEPSHQAFAQMIDSSSNAFMFELAGGYTCLVLPPVGSASSAVSLVKCLERYFGIPIFGESSQVQTQICSPGRLHRRRAALLGIFFYLGSDTLRTYAAGSSSRTRSRTGTGSQQASGSSSMISRRIRDS